MFIGKIRIKRKHRKKKEIKILPLGGGTLKNQKYMLSLAAAIVQPVSGRAVFPTPSPGGKDDPEGGGDASAGLSLLPSDYLVKVSAFLRAGASDSSLSMLRNAICRKCIQKHLSTYFAPGTKDTKSRTLHTREFTFKSK